MHGTEMTTFIPRYLGRGFIDLRTKNDVIDVDMRLENRGDVIIKAFGEGMVKENIESDNQIFWGKDCDTRCTDS